MTSECVCVCVQVELVQAVVDGVSTLVEMEKALEKGKSIEPFISNI